MGWTLHFESTTSGPIRDELIGAFADELADHGGAVSVGSNRFAATFSIEEELRDPADVIRRGTDVYDEAVRNAGLPDSTIVRAEALTWAEFDRDLAEPAYPELVGITEIAELLGVSRQRASALQTRAGFPQPLAVLASGPVWPKPWLTTFIEGWDRKPGRPRKATTRA